MGRNTIGIHTISYPDKTRDLLLKIKKNENINPSAIGGVSRINPTKFGGGLKFESDPKGIGDAPMK
jgi:hypothetical protein